MLPIVVLGLDFLGLLVIHPNVLPSQWLNNNVAISYLGFGGNLFYAHTWLYMLGWVQIVPTIAQPSIAYVILWPVALISISLLALRIPVIEA
ncbi:Uncharacterised protein [Mycobacteroides abscessus subsp. abscessus]|nr:Uncharacterised protein [Mycobacteroides abscessus subsp. abscessus]